MTLDAGARQVVRMTLARPLDDDPVLLGRQREMAALKVVGSGVDASAVGTGKTISSGRALAHRATMQPRFRGLVIAEGRLLGQWREELTRGAPGRGLPPLAPNIELLVISDDRQVAGQIRRFDRELADRPGVVLAPNSVLDRYPADLQTIRWHLLIADEALRYANPATEAHQALAQVRFGAAADCWLLTATPRGKSSEHLDVLVGLALGDEAMISRATEHPRGRRSDGRDQRPPAAGQLRPAPGQGHPTGHAGLDAARCAPRSRSRSTPTPRSPSCLTRSAKAAAKRTGGCSRSCANSRHSSPAASCSSGRSPSSPACRASCWATSGCMWTPRWIRETLTHSKAALAQALVRQGLVHEAMRGGGDGLPLLRGITAQTLAGVACEEQVIVFAERVWCLRQLARTLTERHGVEAHVGDGQVKGAEFELLKRRFTAGEFPVLCLSPDRARGP